MTKVPLKEHVGKKIGVARVIVAACKNDIALFNTKPQNNEELEIALKRMTFLNEIIIRSYMYKPIRAPISFQSCLSKNDQQISNVPYEWIRNIIHKLYVVDQVVPTKTNLLKHIVSANKKYSVTKLDIDLKSNGFVLRKLANTRKALIAEEPKQIYERMKYLNKIRSFRHLKRNFVYVISRNEEYTLAVSPHCEVFRMQEYKYSVEEQRDRTFKFMEDLIPQIPESSVVVFDSDDLIDSNSLPNQHSPKHQMKEWLNQHDIMYDVNAHTAELYCLIRKFGKKYPKTCEVFELLKGYGFDGMQVPLEVRSLSYFNSICRRIVKFSYKNEARYMKSVFTSYGKKEWSDLEETLKMEEIRVYNEDLELETVIDMIRSAATRTELMPKDLISCEEYDKEITPSYIILDPSLD